MGSASTHSGSGNPNVGEACAFSAPPSRQLPDGLGHRGIGIREVFRTYAELAGQAVEVARLSALKTYHRARHGAIENYSRGTRRAQEITTRTWNSANHLKREHPVRVLAIVAGTAFLIGAASRMWRSQNL